MCSLMMAAPELDRRLSMSITINHMLTRLSQQDPSCLNAAGQYKGELSLFSSEHSC